MALKVNGIVWEFSTRQQRTTKRSGGNLLERAVAKPSTFGHRRVTG